MSQKKIVTCFPLDASHVRSIESAAGKSFEVVVADQDSIADRILEADIFCGHAKVPVDWDRVVNAGRLKWIQSSAAGLDHCLSPEVVRSGILVSGCSGLFANQVAEQTHALLFGLFRGLPVFFRQQLRREFVRRPTSDVHGKTIGILGLGGNGFRIAQTLRPIAARIEATEWFDQQLGERAEIAESVDAVLPPSSLDDVLGRSDIVIVALPLTPETNGLIDAARFAAMKRGAWFINVGRGQIVDHVGLVESLRSGHLSGAGLDVCEPEPLPADNPLWEMNNVLITPHVGAQSSRRVHSTVGLFCHNFDLFAHGKPLLNQVDKGLGFPRPEHRIRPEALQSFAK